MKLIEYIIGLIVAGTVIAWLTIGIVLLISLFKSMTNKQIVNCFMPVAILFFVCSIAILIIEGHYDSFFWWLFGIIFGMSAGVNFMIFDNDLQTSRCVYCNSWKVNSRKLIEASYKRDGYTTSSSRMSGDGNRKIVTYTSHDKGEKIVKVHRQLTMCHCKKCDSYYEIWDKGHPENEKEPIKITKERWDKSKVRRICDNLPLWKNRIENPSSESFIYLYGNDDNDREIFPNEK